MPSSLTTSRDAPGATAAGRVPGRCRHLLDLLESLPDPRKARGIRHRLPVLVAVGIVAVLAGARSFTSIGEWAADADDQTIEALGGDAGRRPSESAIRRAFGRLDAVVVDRIMGAWLWTRTRVSGGRRVIAIDGKTIRGARTADAAAPHLVAGLDHASGAVIGQLATAAKSNEIPTVQELLKLLDLTGAVVTMDAMHTQTQTAEQITAAGGDYVFTVKANQPSLHTACKALPWNDIPAHRATQKGHGRRVTRTIKVVAAPNWIGFPGAAQVAQLRRTVTRAGKKTVEVVYLITSADHRSAPPQTLASWVQGHWSIENKLHWVRDVDYDEDRSQVRTGSGPQVMASLRNTAISLLRLAGWDNIARALRHHARHPEDALKLLLTS
jgi:predicted transposase YbfD/YdcC